MTPNHLTAGRSSVQFSVHSSKLPSNNLLAVLIKLFYAAHNLMMEFLTWILTVPAVFQILVMRTNLRCKLRTIFVCLATASGFADALLLPFGPVSTLTWHSLNSLQTVDDDSRRRLFGQINGVLATCFGVSLSPLLGAEARQKESVRNPTSWKGTSLQLMSLEHAVDVATRSDMIWEMGRWPDPILRRPAQNVPDAYFGTETLRIACKALQRTAAVNEAVGLAAQQCGVDARIVYLEPEVYSSKPFSIEIKPALMLINPRIVDRSPEVDMTTWRETCLVLPPTWDATVLRDASVVVEYQEQTGKRNSVLLTGERARAVQHEMDHDRGILITDHVSFEEMENDTMRKIEEPGHNERMQLAYSRYVQPSIHFVGVQ